MNIEREKKGTGDSYVILGDIRAYGEPAGVLDTEEVSKIQKTNEGILHVTRHLTHLSDKARSKLVGMEIAEGGTTVTTDDKFVDEQLKSKGSKFNKKITDPDLLMDTCIHVLEEKIRKGEEIAWIASPAGPLRARIQVDVSADLKEVFGLEASELLGTASVTEITPDIASQIKKEQRGQGEQRDRIEINVLEADEAPQTDNLIIELQKETPDSPPIFYTAYTGILAPQLPRAEQQSPEELAYNQEWWDRHTFIKEREDK